MQTDVYLCFIDCVEAFDKVRYKRLLELLSNFDIFGNGIRIMKKV